VIAEREASAQAIVPPTEEVLADLDSRVLVMTLTDEGLDIDSSSRLWTTRAEYQDNTSLPSLSDVTPDVELLMSGMSRLAMESATASAPNPPASSSSAPSIPIRAHGAHANEQVATPHLHLRPQRARNHLTAKNLVILRRIEDRITLLRNNIASGVVGAWNKEADHLLEALNGVRRKAEVVQEEKRRLLAELKALRDMCIGQVNNQSHARLGPVNYNTGERLVVSNLVCF
jgi:hypothetical protein